MSSGTRLLRQPVSWLALLLIGAGCSGDDSRSASLTAADSSEGATSADSTTPVREGRSTDASSARDASVDPCEALRAEFLQRRDSASGLCSSDSECGCYQGGLIDCGGITDRESLDALSEIASRYFKRCSVTRRCARPRCEPVCIDGRCASKSWQSATPRRAACAQARAAEERLWRQNLSDVDAARLRALLEAWRQSESDDDELREQQLQELAQRQGESVAASARARRAVCGHAQ